jgi:peptidoglycan hydrolase CwlO-like protein
MDILYPLKWALGINKIMATQAEFDAQVTELNSAVAGLKDEIVKLKTDKDALIAAIQTFVNENAATIDTSGLQAVIDGITSATIDIQAVDNSITGETAFLKP